MKKIFVTTLIPLSTILLIGCGETNSSTTIKTNALNTDQSQLTIHIADSSLEESNNSSTTKPLPTQNKPPIAKISTITDNQENNNSFISIHVGDSIIFKGEESYDIDGNITHYIWTDMDNNILSTTKNFSRTFYQPAIYEKTLTVIDNDGARGQQRICILTDINKEDIALIAYTSPDIIITEGTIAPLSGHAVCKTGNFSYEWRENGEVLSNEQNTELLFETGEHDVLLTITDNDTGMKAYKIVKVTVNPETTQN